jgi:poly-gamma-glutamate capsule biosynthesis protein CapA/YwtB (metallophosphatase superfamily)
MTRSNLPCSEHNGNQIAFIGCNPVDLGRPPVATENKPGAAPCSHSYLVNTIQDLDELGYVVIATFQHFEYYSPEARPNQLEDFHRVADAGASIVSGSQAHFAQMMEFYDDSFIHYGLGNLFFDQMGDIPYHPGIRREFIDRYTIYNGKLISVELLTMMLGGPFPPAPDDSRRARQFPERIFPSQRLGRDHSHARPAAHGHAYANDAAAAVHDDYPSPMIMDRFFANFFLAFLALSAGVLPASARRLPVAGAGNCAARIFHF